MTTSQELTEFEREMIVGNRRMEHSSLQTVETFKTHRLAVTRMYRNLWKALTLISDNAIVAYVL